MTLTCPWDDADETNAKDQEKSRSSQLRLRILRACAAVVKHTRAVFLPLNRDASQDTAQFINELPGRLKMVGFSPDVKEPSVVQRLARRKWLPR